MRMLNSELFDSSRTTSLRGVYHHHRCTAFIHPVSLARPGGWLSGNSLQSGPLRTGVRLGGERSVQTIAKYFSEQRNMEPVQSCARCENATIESFCEGNCLVRRY